MPIYEIHDNGGRPYTVEVDGTDFHMEKTHIKIHQNVDGMHIPVFEGDAEVWIGVDPRTEALSIASVDAFGFVKDNPTPVTDLDWRFDGCNILFRTEETGLIWIDRELKVLDIDPSTIELFVSPMGNSDCVYPYIITGTHYIPLQIGIGYPRSLTAGKYHDPHHFWWHEIGEEKHKIPKIDVVMFPFGIGKIASIDEDDLDNPAPSGGCFLKLDLVVPWTDVRVTVEYWAWKVLRMVDGGVIEDYIIGIGDKRFSIAEALNETGGRVYDYLVRLKETQKIMEKSA